MLKERFESGILAELQDLPQWVVWRAELEDSKPHPHRSRNLWTTAIYHHYHRSSCRNTHSISEISKANGKWQTSRSRYAIAALFVYTCWCGSYVLRRFIVGEKLLLSTPVSCMQVSEKGIQGMSPIQKLQKILTSLALLAGILLLFYSFWQMLHHQCGNNPICDCFPNFPLVSGNGYAAIG